MGHVISGTLKIMVECWKCGDKFAERLAECPTCGQENEDRNDGSEHWKDIA